MDKEISFEELLIIQLEEELAYLMECYDTEYVRTMIKFTQEQLDEVIDSILLRDEDES